MSLAEVGAVALAAVALTGGLIVVVLARRHVRRETDPVRRRLLETRATAALHALALLMGLALVASSLPGILGDPTMASSWLLAAAGVLTSIANAAALSGFLFGPGWMDATPVRPASAANPAGDAPLLAAISEGDVVTAVRRYRELTGTSLSEAKTAVDALRAGTEDPASTPRPR